jgi:hypothetical protein
MLKSKHLERFIEVTTKKNKNARTQNKELQDARGRKVALPVRFGSIVSI